VIRLGDAFERPLERRRCAEADRVVLLHELHCLTSLHLLQAGVMVLV